MDCVFGASAQKRARRPNPDPRFAALVATIVAAACDLVALQLARRAVGALSRAAGAARLGASAAGPATRSNVARIRFRLDGHRRGGGRPRRLGRSDCLRRSRWLGRVAAMRISQALQLARRPWAVGLQGVASRLAAGERVVPRPRGGVGRRRRRWRWRSLAWRRGRGRGRAAWCRGGLDPRRLSALLRLPVEAAADLFGSAPANDVGLVLGLDRRLALQAACGAVGLVVPGVAGVQTRLDLLGSTGRGGVGGGQREHETHRGRQCCCGPVHGSTGYHERTHAGPVRTGLAWPGARG
jgi:hypothetical protein